MAIRSWRGQRPHLPSRWPPAAPPQSACMHARHIICTLHVTARMYGMAYRQMDRLSLHRIWVEAAPLSQLFQLVPAPRQVPAEVPVKARLLQPPQTRPVRGCCPPLLLISRWLWEVLDLKHARYYCAPHIEGRTVCWHGMLQEEVAEDTAAGAP